MVALQIREVPEDVREALVGRARARGQSLQAFLLSLVTDEARRSANLASLDRFDGRQDGTTLRSEDVVDAVHAGRAEREAQLTAALSPDVR